MTTPSGYFPTIAADWGGLAAFAARTIEEWQNGLKATWDIVTALLRAGFDAIVGAIAGIPLIGPFIASAIYGVEAFLEDIPGWFNDLRALLGDPLGLGSGHVTLPNLDGIPILGPIRDFAQLLIDAIVNALGIVGSGFTISNVQTHLTSLVGDVASSLSQWVSLLVNSGIATAAGLGSALSTTFGDLAAIVADFWGLVNAISNALGHLGSGHSIADVQSYVSTLSGDVSTLVTDLIAIITGAGQSTAAGLGSAISAAFSSLSVVTNIVQDIINAIGNILGHAGSGFSVANIQSWLGTALSGIIPAIQHNFDGTVAALTGMVSNLDGTFSYEPVVNAVQGLISNLDGTFATAAQVVSNAANAAASVVGNTMTAAAAGVQNIVSGVFGAFSGLGAAFFNQGVSYQQMTEAAKQTYQIIIDTSAALTVIQTQLAQAQGSGQGIAISLPMAEYADGALPGTFTTPLSSFLTTTVTVSGGYAVANTPSGTPAGGARYNTATYGDNQLVTGIFSGVSINANEYVYLVGRCNSAGNSYVLAYYDANKQLWWLNAVVAGSLTILGLGVDQFANGAAYTLVCGVGASANRSYQILKNGVPLSMVYWPQGAPGGFTTTILDSANITQMGASYRYCGFGLNGNPLMPKLSMLAITETIPPSQIGSGFKAYLSGSTALAASSGGNESLFPNSFFDSLAFVSNDLTYDPATANKITVSVSGWYRVSMQHSCNALYTAGGSYWGFILYKNGVKYEHGTLLPTFYSTGHTFTVYLAAGDYIQPGYRGSHTTGAGGTLGDAAGYYTWWDVSLMNCGTIS